MDAPAKVGLKPGYSAAVLMQPRPQVYGPSVWPHYQRRRVLAQPAVFLLFVKSPPHLYSRRTTAFIPPNKFNLVMVLKTEVKKWRGEFLLLCNLRLTFFQI